MNKQKFQAGVHLVALEGNTTPEDFLSAFQYENRHLEHINPSIYNLRNLDLSKNPCPIVLLPHQKEDCGRFIDRLYELSTLYSSTIFVFFSEPLECINEAQQYFTTILTYDKSTNGGTVKKGAGDIHEGLYTLDPLSNAKEEVLKEPSSDDSAHDAAPQKKPTETVIEIKNLAKSRGFHQVRIPIYLANAMLRGEKTDYICSASINVQKGDWVVITAGDILELESFHDINSIVWNVTFVSYIPQTEGDRHGHLSLSLRRIPNARYERGVMNARYHTDCIVFSNP